MGTTYSIADYMGPFLAYTLGSALIMGALCVFLGRELKKSCKSFGLLMFLSLAISVSFAC